MPRRSGGGGGRAPASRGPVRPAAPVAPQRNTANPGMPQGARPASTAVPPTGAQQAPGAGQLPQQRQPGLFGQMASTAAGVAVGSSIGHAIGGFFGGGQANAASQEQADGALQAQQQSMQQPNQQGYARCELVARDLTKCLDENSGSQHQMSICSYYLDQLRACQAAASQY